MLNHITISCRPLTYEPFDDLKHVDLSTLCTAHGMIDISNYSYLHDADAYPVMINGRHAGYVEDVIAEDFMQAMRRHKITGQQIPWETEMAWLRKGHFRNTVYPMIYISTAPARLQRPVQNVRVGAVEWLSPLEQISADIDLPEAEYSEVSIGNIFSILPQQIPFINYNQSPRNMYQCQMAKQTMGTSVLNWDFRFDNKLYRILHSQKPLVRNNHYDAYRFGDYNSGSNAVVAVLSYTGYDMEDAMIINKSSYEAGFGHGCVYKTV